MKKEYRLKKSHEIAKIVKNRTRVANDLYTIYYKKYESLKIAISINKKYGNAVERNYAKRIIRECIRPRLITLPSIALVIVIKNNFKECDFLTKQSELNNLINYLLRKEKMNELSKKN